MMMMATSKSNITNQNNIRENKRNSKEKKETEPAANPWQDIDEMSKIGKIY